MSGKQYNTWFDACTQQAKNALSFAQEEAQRFRRDYIGTEHLLLGQIHENEGVAAQVLIGRGVGLDNVRSRVELIVGRGDRAVGGAIGLSPHSKKAIELAVDEAMKLNHQHIGTEHLLLGLIREGEGIAVGVLEALGVSREKARFRTLQMLKPQ